MGIEGFTEESYFDGARLHASLRNRGDDVIRYGQSLPQDYLGRRIEAYIQEGIRLMENCAAWAARNGHGAELVRAEVRCSFVVVRKYVLPDDKKAETKTEEKPSPKG